MEYIFPQKVLLSSDNVSGAENLLKEKTLQIALVEHDKCVMPAGSYVILDFGKELSGGARILTSLADEGKRVRLRFGESVAETCAELKERGASNDHSNRDMEVVLQNYSDMQFGQTGFRFLRIDTLFDEGEIQLKTIVANVNTDTREEVGSFTCDDPLVNEIWNTAAYTIRLCLQNGYFWDGIKRDRLVWIGDLYPEMRAAQCLFESVPETLNSLVFAKEEATLPLWMDGMPAYSLWWLIILHGEYENSGNLETVKNFMPYIKPLLEQISAHVNADGTTSYPSNFIDWPTYEPNSQTSVKGLDSAVGIAYLTEIAIARTIELLKACGEDVSLCEDILARLSKWDKRVTQYKQVAAIGVLAGDNSDNNKNLLLAGGARGMSTFMSYPILTGVATYGEYETALSMMKEYYGGMLSVGATSFWEDFDLDWLENASRIDELPKAGQVDIHGDKGAFCYKGFRHSFCHGWSAGVIPYLMETVAGVKIVEAGMKKIAIKPQLSGLKEVKASCPTPYGVLRVEHTLQADGSVKTVVDAPKEIEIVR